jgi:hypothetical protein
MKEQKERKKSNWGWAERAGLTPEKLQALYLEKTDREIADPYDVTEAAVAAKRRQWGIPTMTMRQRRELEAPRALSLDTVTPSGLAEMHLRMGVRQIAAFYGVQKPAITRLLRRWGIAPLSKTERATKTEAFTDEQREFILGSLLGDGYLSESGVFKIAYSSDQIGYLQRSHALLAPHVVPIYYEEKELPSGQLCFAFGFRTVQHKWLKSLHKTFYPEGRKVFPASVLEQLSAKSLAYWYCDDGHLDKESGLPSIALGAISETEAQQVACLVGKRFGLDVYPKSPGVNCQILGMRATSTEVFFHLVRDYLGPDMQYKIPPKYRVVGSGLQMPLRTSQESIVLPKELSNQCQLWASLSEEAKEALLQELILFWHKAGFPYAIPRCEELVTLLHLDPEQVIQNGVVKNRQVGQATCHAFATPIWSATSYGSKQSPFALFEDADSLRGALKFLLDQGSVPTAAMLRSGLRIWKRSGVYNFRPSAAKALTDRYCRPGGIVWDPCAGYGGRLLGVLLSRTRPQYVACEPQTETYARLHDLVHWVEGYVPGVASKVTLHNVPAEEFQPPSRVDMVLTSPPYWKREVYGKEETQAGVRYPTYVSWLENFWRIVLQKAVTVLIPGGWLIVNVDDFRVSGQDYSLVNDTLRICQEFQLGTPEVLKYAVPSMGMPNNHETVLCFPKGHVLEPSVVSPSDLAFSRCSKCGKAVTEAFLFDGICKECLAPKGFLTICKGCGKEFLAQRRGTQEFHDKACHGRWRRRQFRASHPAKTTRVFVCQTCGISWETAEEGSFRYCPRCKEQQELEARKKTCAYRHCGQKFTDTSSKNSMTFCCPEHRRREKLFRSGLATNLDYFKKPDPVLGSRSI